jgi:hypothetical protein
MILQRLASAKPENAITGRTSCLGQYAFANIRKNSQLRQASLSGSRGNAGFAIVQDVQTAAPYLREQSVSHIEYVEKKSGEEQIRDEHGQGGVHKRHNRGAAHARRAALDA